MTRPWLTICGLMLLAAANASATLALLPWLGYLSLPPGPSGWQIIVFMALVSLVPVQLCFMVGWVAMGQQHWALGILLAAGAAIYVRLALQATKAMENPDLEDELMLLTSMAPATYAVLRPLSVIAGWEFGPRLPTQHRGQFRLLDIMEWTAAAALACLLAQASPFGAVILGICLTCSLIALLASAAKRYPLILLVVAGGVTAAAAGIYVFLPMKIIQAIGGFVAGATVCAATNLFLLNLLGYKLRRRPRRSTERFPAVAAEHCAALPAAVK